MRKDIKDLIQSNSVCVLATVSEGNPHCCLMSYSTDIDSREIYMITQRETKKYRNLKENPSVSILIDTRQTDSKSRTKALTITGTFQNSVDENKKSIILASLLDKNPNLKEFIDDPAAEIIVVQVKAVQLLDGIKESYFEIVPQ
jgi:nitroimidazol reductase NimA-like FMN-containing flavoprotein (pyridoxamine 5'-phosphate oxidase superfamily)